MVMQRVKTDEPYAIIRGSGTKHWYVEIWTERYHYIPDEARIFSRRGAAERWANKMLSRARARAEHERERIVIY